MKIHSINGKIYIRLSNLLYLGFPIPKKGTSILYMKNWIGTEICNEYLRFYEKKEGWDGVFISLFASEIGKFNVSEEDVYIPFTQDNFTPQYGLNIPSE
jgi:hypothetical protein